MVSNKKEQNREEQFTDFLNAIGSKLKELREKAGYTSYEHFAYDHNFGRAQYGKYERGTEDMRLSSLFRILEVMNISWSDFFKDIQNK
ncbi:helix-turn-helix domain-containing protein [Niabella beijingensis]|uniref:helix-turn-helix domain-containing protein n=1 Tax=Niabella beijingensis TaxID=2872700 RepID=UPI001CBB7F63|nr:helix-turn-helix transcriptional regulator [Niabella beijingensis]MBZ4188949.1 helix-turn-helix domain-containing protein [Niabella beijingensis]